MNYTNYSIKSKNGKFYTTSKVEKEGYTPNKYIDKSTGTEVTNYHKEVTNLKGKLVKWGVKESQFGERFYIMLKQDGDDVDVLDMPIFNGSSNSINDYIKSICQYIDSFDKDVDFEMYLNSKNKDKNGYLYKNVFININGESLKWNFKLYGEDSIVPPPIETVNKVTKKKSWDYSDADAFFYEKIKGGNVNESDTQTSASDSNVETQEESNDDLPF
jgi:hypothetical protein